MKAVSAHSVMERLALRAKIGEQKRSRWLSVVEVVRGGCITVGVRLRRRGEQSRRDEEHKLDEPTGRHLQRWPAAPGLLWRTLARLRQARRESPSEFRRVEPERRTQLAARFASLPRAAQCEKQASATRKRFTVQPRRV